MPFSYLFYAALYSLLARQPSCHSPLASCISSSIPFSFLLPERAFTGTIDRSLPIPGSEKREDSKCEKRGSRTRCEFLSMRTGLSRVRIIHCANTSIRYPACIQEREEGGRKRDGWYF